MCSLRLVGLKLLPLVSALSLFPLSENSAQEFSTSMSPVDTPVSSIPARRYDLLKATFEPSYITGLGGWGNSGDKLLFEANLAPHLAFGGSKATFVLTPKIVLRMFDAPSAPVRRPSFMPRGTLHLPLRDTSIWGVESLTSLSFAISHHSNGQDGAFYDSGTRDLNTRDGSFSLNYAELAYSATTQRPGTPFTTSSKVGIRANLPVNETAELRDSAQDRYGTYRVFSSGVSISDFANFFGINTDFLSLRVLTSAEYSYVIDRNFRSEPFVSWQRFNGSWSVVYMPPLAEDAGLFFNYYWGQDYYNMSYKHRLKVFRVGILMNATTSFLRPR